MGGAPERIDGPRRALALLKEHARKLTEESLGVMPLLLSSLKSDDPHIVMQSIVEGMSLFSAVLEEMAHQLHKSGDIDGWLAEVWAWMVKFKDAVCGILFEPCSLGAKVLAVKFLEICVFFFTSDAKDSEEPFMRGNYGSFNVSWLTGGHPILNVSLLTIETNKILGLLMDVLQSRNGLHGCLTITVINCLAAIAKNRTVHYNCILSALLNLDPSSEFLMGDHAASIRYSLRTAFLGFLKCTHPTIVESRDRLVRALRAMNYGEAGEQVIRQVDKMSKIERSRDIRYGKDDSSRFGDSVRKRAGVQANSDVLSSDMPAKRTRNGAPLNSNQNGQLISDIINEDDDFEDADVDDEGDNDVTAVSDFPSKTSSGGGNLTPIETMIAMIGALLAEGERGVESLEILISNIHSDLLADIVIENMKNLPNNGLPVVGKRGNLPVNSQTSSFGPSSRVESMATSAVSGDYSLSSSLEQSAETVAGSNIVISDTPSLPNISVDSKRDPRRDPRRLDPRRTAVSSVEQQLVPTNPEDISSTQSGINHVLNKTVPVAEMIKTDILVPSTAKIVELPENSVDTEIEVADSKESSMASHDAIKTEQPLDLHRLSDLEHSPSHVIGEELAASTPPDATPSEVFTSNAMEADHHPSSISATLTCEDICHSLPVLPLYVELTDEQRRIIHKLAVIRIIEDRDQSRGTGCGQMCVQILARLVAQLIDVDDIVMILQRHIIFDYHHYKGHELAINILYQLHAIGNSDQDGPMASLASSAYDKFVLALAKLLLDSLPASDKSFSKLLGEAPSLPRSTFKLLEDLCHSHGYDQHGKDVFDGDRVTQGLGAIWSLILGRPLDRQACLDIALKCAVDSQDDVRARAVRLVSNKLYLLPYATEYIEQFATSTLLSVVDQKGSEEEERLDGRDEMRQETGSPETSLSSSQNTEAGTSESRSIKGIQSMKSAPILSLSQAQQQTSLIFALCAKKPKLLQLVFDVYGRSPKAVKQSIHRHVPIIIRGLGSSSSELLHIISNPPEGSENLIMLVLQILTEEMTPAADLVAAVKHLYETKLKDAAILIPLLASFSKDEVLPIFPRLVNLPLEKFQMALARILQGSAHTGPALTPVEVLVAIHRIDPEKDGIALKKITDACSACFEQRTVFTQQVLAKSLNHLVEQVPLPLLFMRTVIQAIDAFPTLVNFVMDILSKLVSRQIWKMPKLWVGFLKCISQTQPHSFPVLLQLPKPQLENVLNRYASLRGPLVAYVNQPNMRTSTPRPTLRVLGLTNDSEQGPRPFFQAPLHPSDTSSSIHSTNPS